MNEKEQSIIESLINKVKNKFMGEGSGHDWYHIERVYNMSKKLAILEGVEDSFVLEAAALLHDIADHKFHNGDETMGPKVALDILKEFDLAEDRKQHIIQIIKEISFKGAGVPTPMSSKEGQLVQDADRLDAIGAIGIARTFAYGGHKNHPIYDPFIKPTCHTSFDAYKKSTAPTINHFYEKLLLLKDLMNSDSAKKIAEKRHSIMENFLQDFYAEWESRDF